MVRPAIAGASRKIGHFYGPRIITEFLSNRRLTTNAVADGVTHVTFRFRARKTGAVNHFLWFNRYSNGDGGYNLGSNVSIQVQLRKDGGAPNHWPDMSAGGLLATATLSNAETQGFFPGLTFASPPTLQGDMLYHAVITNTSGNPATQYVSVNHCLIFGSILSPMQKGFNDLDMYALESGNSGSTWGTPAFNDTPIFQVKYSDGTLCAGQAYMDGQRADGNLDDSVRRVGANYLARQTINPAYPVRVTGAGIFAKRVVAGTGFGMDFAMVDGSDVAISGASGTIPATSFPQGTWTQATVTFGTPAVLQPGTTYKCHIGCSDTSQTVYYVYGIEEGDSYGFLTGAYFSEGRAEYKNPAGSWTGWMEYGTDNRTDIDLAGFYWITG